MVIIQTMKIENLTTKFPKKINGELVEFMIENPSGSYDELLELAEINNSGDLVGSGINQIRKRYGSIISINKLSHWSFVLFTRYAKSLNYSYRSASKMIDILIDQMRSNKNKDSKNQISYEELIKFFNRKYIYQYAPDSMQEVAEIFVPDFTYHEIPIFREIGSDNVFYFELENIDDLSTTILKLINSKSDINTLIDKGRERLKKFSRKAFVKDFENIIFQKIK